MIDSFEMPGDFRKVKSSLRKENGIPKLLIRKFKTVGAKVVKGTFDFMVGEMIEKSNDDPFSPRFIHLDAGLILANFNDEVVVWQSAGEPRFDKAIP